MTIMDTGPGAVLTRPAIASTKNLEVEANSMTEATGLFRTGSSETPINWGLYITLTVESIKLGTTIVPNF